MLVAEDSMLGYADALRALRALAGRDVTVVIGGRHDQVSPPMLAFFSGQLREGTPVPDDHAEEPPEPDTLFFQVGVDGRRAGFYLGEAEFVSARWNEPHRNVLALDVGDFAVEVELH